MVRNLAITLLFITGLAALAGGWGFVSDPSGEKMQIPLEWLQNTPFNSYFIPGLILLIVLGLGSIGAAFVSIRRLPHYSQWIISIGAIIVGWITIQVLMLQMLHWLHYLFGGIGWGILILGLVERKVLAADPDQGG